MVKSLKLFLILLFLPFSTKAPSCANYYYAFDKEGHINALEDDNNYHFDINFNVEGNIDRLKKLEAKLKKEKNYMLLSDYGVCLMKLGKVKESLDLFIEIYKHYPNEYKIAANLGTAYELNGENDSALKYIRRDMELNPNDHKGSEWIHASILETKIQLAHNPDYLKSHTVLGLTDKQKNDSLVLQQLFIQLYERVPFSAPPNEIMVSLFTDLGDISANINSIEYAKAYYQIAKEYYGGTSTALDEKIKQMVALKHKYGLKTPPGFMSFNHQEKGDNNMIGGLKYKWLLNDNNTKHKKLDWSKINTDVVSLLAMVNFTMTPIAAKDSASNSPARRKDELKLMKDSSLKSVKQDTGKNIAAVKDVTVLTYEKEKPTRIWIYGIAVIVIVGGAMLAIARKKK
jgi:tetratricopeptide (TPR) repeat protein